MKHKALQEPKPFKTFRDKYLAVCMMAAALLISFVASAQLDSAKYSAINGYGFRYKRMAFDSVLMIPRSTSPHVPYRAGAVTYKAADSTLQLWTGNQWLTISSGTAIDTANAWINLIRRRSGTDTVEFFKGGAWQFAYKDSGVAQRFGLEDNLATATRTFNAAGYDLNFDSVGNHYVYSKVKAAGSGADAGLRGELSLSNGTINLWAYHSNNVSTRSYGFNAYPGLTQMFAAGHVSGHAGFVQADTNQVILESDPYRFYLFHDSAMLGRIDGGTADIRIRTLPQTTDTTTWKPLAIGTNGQLKIVPGWPGGGGGSALLDTLQSITSGSTATITDGTNIVYIDPASNLSSLAVTLPARPHPSNEITVYFGGTITSGSVVTTLSFVGNTGQTILQASSPSTVYAGDFAISYRFRTSNSKWYRKQ